MGHDAGGGGDGQPGHPRTLKEVFEWGSRSSPDHIDHKLLGRASRVTSSDLRCGPGPDPVSTPT